MNKHEWRKQEKEIYLPKKTPAYIEIPAFQFLTISGAGNPNGDFFSDCVGALYSLSYGIKMTAKKKPIPLPGYQDYTVYPLEGVWDLREEAREAYDGTFDKDDLVFQLMIRQPDFVDEAFFQEVRETVKVKKPHPLLDQLALETIEEGSCVQMLHIGPYDDEPASFEVMEAFAETQGLNRLSKVHREIYLSDPKKVAPDKLKTALRFRVAP